MLVVLMKVFASKNFVLMEIIKISSRSLQKQNLNEEFTHVVSLNSMFKAAFVMEVLFELVLRPWFFCTGLNHSVRHF